MANRELKITLDLDNSRAQAQARAFRADQQKLQADMTADATRAENAKVSAARDAQGRYVSASRAATDAIKGDFRSQGEAATGAFGAAGGAVRSFFANQAIQHTLAQAGWSKLTEMVGAYGRAVTEAQQKRDRMAADLTAGREDLGQLANLMGRKDDSAFVVEMARFAKEAGGLTPGETRTFMESFYNSGAQYKGDRISAPEFDQFAGQSARLALARKVDPGMVADLASKQLGFRDYSKFGEQASETALGDVNQALAILSSGGGNESQLGTEVAKLAASSLSEDKLRGAFTSIKDVATVVSVLTEGFPEGQAEAGRGVLRATRGFDKAQGPFLTAAKVSPEDDVFTAVKKVGDYAMTQATGGLTAEDVLRKNIPDELGARGINVLYNRGVAGGLFARREGVAAEAAGPGPALAAMAEYGRSERGLSREADADQVLAERELASRTAGLDIVRRGVIAQMTRTGELDAYDKKTKDFLVGAGTFGLIGDATRRRVDMQVLETLHARTPSGVLPPDEAETITDPKYLEEKLQNRISALEGLGIDPYHDKDPLGPVAGLGVPPGTAAAGRGGARPEWAREADAHQGAMLDVLKSIDTKLGKQVDKPPQAPPARPIMPAPPVMSR